MATSTQCTEVRNLLKNTITVEDLIAELQNFPGDARVVLAAEYGDYGRTLQALGIDRVESLEDSEELLCRSAYSRSHVSLEPIDFDEDGDAEGDDAVVVLR